MKNELVSEYKAALKMLLDTVKKCPDDLWESVEYENAFWRIAYHALFYTSFYLSQSPDKFVPWDKHIHNYNGLGTVTYDQQPIIINVIYSKNDLIDYAGDIWNDLENKVSEENMDQPCGFSWIPMNRLQLHLYNIRHLQHHVGQMTERLHQKGIKGINWEG